MGEGSNTVDHVCGVDRPACPNTDRSDPRAFDEMVGQKFGARRHVEGKADLRGRRQLSRVAHPSAWQLRPEF
jgi:hypothetical protein